MFALRLVDSDRHRARCHGLPNRAGRPHVVRGRRARGTEQRADRALRNPLQWNEGWRSRQRTPLNPRQALPKREVQQRKIRSVPNRSESLPVLQPWPQMQIHIRCLSHRSVRRYSPLGSVPNRSRSSLATNRSQPSSLRRTHRSESLPGWQPASASVTAFEKSAVAVSVPSASGFRRETKPPPTLCLRLPAGALSRPAPSSPKTPLCDSEGFDNRSRLDAC